MPVRSSRALACRRASDECGVVGGVEALPFGLLVFAAGTLIATSLWGVVDAKLAVEAAAREAARAYVEAPDEATAVAAAREAAAAALRGHARDPAAAQVEIPPPGSFERCRRVTVAVSYAVPVLRLPWLGPTAVRPIVARGAHSELVDPYRTGLPVTPQGARCGP